MGVIEKKGRFSINQILCKGNDCENRELLEARLLNIELPNS